MVREGYRWGIDLESSAQRISDETIKPSTLADKARTHRSMIKAQRPDPRYDRIFVEWHDPERPNWGGYVSSLDPHFQSALVEFVEKCGPPTKVEFRAHSEGWAVPQPCEDCGLSIGDCHCGEQQCPECSEWFSADPDDNGRCPVCVEPPCWT